MAFRTTSGYPPIGLSPFRGRPSRATSNLSRSWSSAYSGWRSPPRSFPYPKAPGRSARVSSSSASARTASRSSRPNGCRQRLHVAERALGDGVRRSRPASSSRSSKRSAARGGPAGAGRGRRSGREAGRLCSAAILALARRRDRGVGLRADRRPPVRRARLLLVALSSRSSVTSWRSSPAARSRATGGSAPTDSCTARKAPSASSPASCLFAVGVKSVGPVRASRSRRPRSSRCAISLRGQRGSHGARARMPPTPSSRVRSPGCCSGRCSRSCSRTPACSACSWLAADSAEGSHARISSPACSSLASRCCCSRPSRPRCCPSSPRSRARASTTTSASACAASSASSSCCA